MQRIFGVDFTSRPTRRKPITCAVCHLDGATLVLERVDRWTSFDEFEAALARAGPWAAALDFPFGQSDRFITNIGWPATWAGYVDHVAGLDRGEFRTALDDYRAPRPAGDKEHQRASDHLTGAISPQKLYGVPVGLMFFEGAKRLAASGVTVAGLKDGDPARVVFEAYPGVLARKVTRSGYKNDDKKKQTDTHRDALRAIESFVFGDGVVETYGVQVTSAGHLADDPTGDTLDALLCAIQCAWAWRAWPALKARLTEQQKREGWIADPILFETS